MTKKVWGGGEESCQDAFDLSEDTDEVISWELGEGGHHTVIKMTLPSCRREETANELKKNLKLNWVGKRREKEELQSFS